MFININSRYILIALILIVVLLICYQNSKSSDSNGFTFLKTWTEDSFSNLWEKSHLLNLRNFDYEINNEDHCKGNESIILIVTSYAGHVEARSAMRIAYPKTELQKLGIARVFLLAKLTESQQEVSQLALLNENQRFNDLIQGNFYESYRNLTYKHVMGLKWAVTYCSKMKYIIKMDDDIIVNLFDIVQMIGEKFKPSTDLMGYVFEGMKPIRMKANKWYVTKEEYPGNNYPPFLSGWMYVTTPPVAARLVDICHLLPYFWIDDLFVTGLAASEINCTFIDIGDYFTTHPEILECCISQNVKCQYVVSPSGGDFKLQIRFKQHSEKCRVENVCKVLAGNSTIDKTCVTKRKLFPLKKGIPSFRVVKL